MEKVKATNNIILYKNRIINESKPVKIYRNLNCGKTDKLFSIKQAGQVVGHTNSLWLEDCTFIVNKKGQESVRKNKRKQVHAYIKGLIHPFHYFYKASEVVIYNPYVNDTFVTSYKQILTTAKHVFIKDSLVFAFGINNE